MTTRVVVAGSAGRMGREIAAAAAGDPDVEVVGGTTRSTTAAEAAELLRQADVLVDFTVPGAAAANARAAAEARKALVCGTTGLSAEQIGELRSVSSQVPVLYSRNTSVGINTLLKVLPLLAKAFDGYDVEITEAHHRGKKDAPSGTALALAEALGADMAKAVYGRQGIQPRRPGEIGIQAIRAGGNAGEHWVLFADEGEQIQVVHRAYSRRTFALGALRAAKWLAAQPPGYYTMADVLS